VTKWPGTVLSLAYRCILTQWVYRAIHVSIIGGFLRGRVCSRLRADLLAIMLETVLVPIAVSSSMFVVPEAFATLEDACWNTGLPLRSSSYFCENLRVLFRRL